MLVLHVWESVGVIGVSLPERLSLSGFIRFVGPALVYGNAVIVVPHLQSAIFALEFCEVRNLSILM